MRLGLHLNSLAHRDRVEAYVRAVHPALVKMLAGAYDPWLVDLVHEHGGRVVCRRVWSPVEDDWNGSIAAALHWGAERGWKMDLLEWANEESQGKDDPGEWDRLCRYALKFCKELDALRVGTRGCVLNTSCGQPEEGYWARADALALARYCAAHGHVIGVHAYYRPVAWQGVPWRKVDRGLADWGRVDGAWMLREMHAVWAWRANGIKCRFIVTESGRDAMSGTPGAGAGYHDGVRADYAPAMEWYGRHLSAVPECAGWVDFGWGGSPRWESFDMAGDTATQAQMTAAMVRLPRGSEGNVTLDAEAAAHQCIKLNPGAAIQKAARAKGYWPTGEEWASPTLNGHACQRYEDPATGKVFVGEWTGAGVAWHQIPH